jgi:hypothetical protein
MPCQKLFQAKPMPELRVPGLQMAIASVGGGEIVEIAGLRPDAEPFQILR